MQLAKSESVDPKIDPSAALLHVSRKKISYGGFFPLLRPTILSMPPFPPSCSFCLWPTSTAPLVLSSKVNVLALILLLTTYGGKRFSRAVGRMQDGPGGYFHIFVWLCLFCSEDVLLHEERFSTLVRITHRLNLRFNSIWKKLLAVTNCLFVILCFFLFIQTGKLTLSYLEKEGFRL